MLRKQLLILLAGAASLNAWAAPVFNIIPLYGIEVKSDGIKFADIQVRSEAGLIYNNEVPQLAPFEVVVDKPEGFRDSAGYVKYGYAFSILDESGATLAHSDDIFRSSTEDYSSEMENIKLTLTFDRNMKPNTFITVVGRIFDKAGKGYIHWKYKVKVVAASRKLLAGSMLYNYSTSQGLAGKSIGLHYNFFEFKGKEGNRFIYRVGKGEEFRLVLRGLDGWKVTEGKTMPGISAVLMNDTGLVLEEMPDLLDKELSKGMDQDKRELQIRVKPKAGLMKEGSYLVWVKIRDKNNPKNVMDLVIRFYVE